MTGFSFTPFERVSSRREKKGKGGRERKEKSAQEKKALHLLCVFLHVCAMFYRYRHQNCSKTLV